MCSCGYSVQHCGGASDPRPTQPVPCRLCASFGVHWNSVCSVPPLPAAVYPPPCCSRDGLSPHRTVCLSAPGTPWPGFAKIWMCWPTNPTRSMGCHFLTLERAADFDLKFIAPKAEQPPIQSKPAHDHCLPARMAHQWRDCELLSHEWQPITVMSADYLPGRHPPRSSVVMTQTLSLVHL